MLDIHKNSLKCSQILDIEIKIMVGFITDTFPGKPLSEKIDSVKVGNTFVTKLWQWRPRLWPHLYLICCFYWPLFMFGRLLPIRRLELVFVLLLNRWTNIPKYVYAQKHLHMQVCMYVFLCGLPTNSCNRVYSFRYWKIHNYQFWCMYFL